MTQKATLLAKLQEIDDINQDGIRPKELSNLTGIPEPSVRRFLGELVKDGKLYKKKTDMNKTIYKFTPPKAVMKKLRKGGTDE